MKPSAISWTDHSGGNLNFVIGCSPVSPGCVNCYARAWADRYRQGEFWVESYPEKLDNLRRMQFPEFSPKRGAPHRPMAFVVDMGDLFHNEIPDDFIAQAFQVMAEREDVLWQVLTKRARRMRTLLSFWASVSTYPAEGVPNVWLGVSAETQARADERIPLLLETPAAVRWVSVEPMLGPVDLDNYLRGWFTGVDTKVVGEDEYGSPILEPAQAQVQCPSLDWVVCGGESGPSRRPFVPAWAIDLYKQCRAAGVPYFYKQGSALQPGQDDELPGIGKIKEWPDG